MSDISTQTISVEAAAPVRLSGDAAVGDFLVLLKPRVMSLVIFTAFTGMAVAPGTLHPWLQVVALIAIAVGAGGSAALNMWYDADIDKLMSRTARRPVPAGRITGGEALGFGLVLSLGSVFVLGTLINWTAGALLAFTIFFYAVIYSMWLKRSTPHNIVIGGAAGAFPPMVGWVAVTGSLDLASLSLFAIIFIWTPPHFWALALYRSADYARAGIPMLPVVAGPAETRRQIMLYSLVMVPVALVPCALGIAGPVFAVTALVLGLIFLALAWRVFKDRDGANGDRAAKRLFGFSIFYLFLVFASLLVEKALAIPAFTSLLG